MKHLTWTLLLCLLVGTAGCSSAPSRADKPATEQDDPLDLDAPSPEELADSPCGNPNWSKLPSTPPNDDAQP